MARGGAANVVWYDGPKFLPLARYWAHRASVIHGRPFVAVGDIRDYHALDAKHAIIPSVVDFGGTFPVAEAGISPRHERMRRP